VPRGLGYVLSFQSFTQANSTQLLGRRQANVAARCRPPPIESCKTGFTNYYNCMTRRAANSAYKRPGEDHSREAEEMKTNKRIFVTMLALLLAAAVSLSAGGEKEHWAKLKQELNLADAQVTQLQQKFEALRPQGEAMEQRVKALRSEIENQEKAAAPDRMLLEQKKTELASAKKEWKEKVTDLYRSVLNKEQYAKWEQMESNYQHEKEKKDYSEKKKKD
jgi:cell division protein FtsB